MGSDNLNKAHKTDGAGELIENNFPSNDFEELVENLENKRNEISKKIGGIF